MNLVLTSGELRVLDTILQRLAKRTEEEKDLVNVYQEDVELIESLTNKVQPSVSHRKEHGRMTLKHTTKSTWMRSSTG